jgi:hypothetical protein
MRCEKPGHPEHRRDLGEANAAFPSGRSKEIVVEEARATGFLDRILTALTLHGVGEGAASALSQTFWKMPCIEMARVNDMVSTKDIACNRLLLFMHDESFMHEYRTPHRARFSNRRQLRLFLRRKGVMSNGVPVLLR